jgi:hypothetical protein
MVLAKLYKTMLFATYTSTNLTISYVSQNGQRSYPLRPELIESTYWLFKATRDYRCVFLCKVKMELVLFKYVNLLDSVALTTRRDRRLKWNFVRMVLYGMLMATKGVYLWPLPVRWLNQWTFIYKCKSNFITMKQIAGSSTSN